MKMDYSQPAFYHFNQDSTQLIHFVISSFKGRPSPQTVLDLGAGCGVLGIEYALQAGEVELTLVEGQMAFLEHLEANLKEFNIKGEVIHSLFSNLNLTKKYDLILSNPPYFYKGAGEVSSSNEKQMCRTWEHDNLSMLITLIRSLLNKNGESWLSLRSDKMTLSILKSHGINEIHQISSNLIYIRVLA